MKIFEVRWFLFALLVILCMFTGMSTIGIYNHIKVEDHIKEIWIGSVDRYPDGTTYIIYSIEGECHHIGFPNHDHFIEYLLWLEERFIIVNRPIVIVKTVGGEESDLENLR